MYKILFNEFTKKVNAKNYINLNLSIRVLLLFIIFAQNKSMSIEVKNITKTYGEQKALDNVSFSVNKGEIVGFLGPNGAGKSTLMKILTTYLTSDEGSANVNGFDVAQRLKKVYNNRWDIYQNTIRCIWIYMFVNI